MSTGLLEDTVEGEITVACYDTVLTKNLLDAAASAFEAKYPGTKVNVESFSEMPEIRSMEQDGMTMSVVTMGDDRQAKNDYINKINAQLMSGQGADVIAMDILPWFRYAENGLLEDLQPYMEGDPAYIPSDYAQNIIDALRYLGKQYVMPLNYDFSFYAYDETLLDEAARQRINDTIGLTYEKLMDIGKDAFNAYNASAETPVKMFGQPPAQLFNAMMMEQYERFIDIPTRKANFNDGSFASLLNEVQQYEANGFTQTAMRMNMDTQEAMQAMQQTRDESFFFKQQNSMNLFTLFNTTDIKVNMSLNNSAGLNDNDRLAGLSAGAEGQYPFSVSQQYAINANSTNKRTAWEFMKFLMAPEQQASFYLMGQPVNHQARAEKVKQTITGTLTGLGGMNFESVSNTGELDEEQQLVYDTYMHVLEDYTALLNKYHIVDDTVQTLISEETEKFFNGSQSAEAAAEAVQNVVSLYLNE